MIGRRQHFLKGSTSIEGRLRLTAAMLLLAVPIGVGIWAFAGYAGRSAQDRADTQLSSVLGSALQEYSLVLQEASAKATATAGRRDVQRALADGRRAELARLAQSEGLRFDLPGKPSIGQVRSPAAVRSVVVVVGGKRVGRVVAAVPLDNRLLRRLSRAAALPDGDLLAFRGGPVASRQTLTIRESEYRSAAAKLLSGPHELSLLALAPAARVEASASDARKRVLLAGLAGLVGLVLLVYGFAPVIARGRTVRSQRDQAARVLSHLGEGVALIDAAGVVQLWNPAAEAITGLRADAVQGRPAVEAVPGWDDVQAEVTVGGRPATVSLPAAAGRELYLSVTGARFSDGTVYTFRDLTEERRLEQMRSDFVATVSHELRTPLASIHGAALTLSRRGSELEPALSDRLLTIIREQSERLAELVEQILLAAQLDSGGLRYASEEFDARELAKNVIEAAGPRIPAEIAVTLTALPGLPPVLGDPQKVRRVLTNLVDNAVKYSPDGGRVSVILAMHDDRLRFTVHDEGLGIPSAEHERIFEKFYRLDAGMSRGVGGSGLGLYICRELVHGMGGRLWVVSEPGRGSSFAFELPVVAERSAIAG